MTVGRYVDFDPNRGSFVYQYTCTACSRPFRSTAPEATDPVMCHHCFTGGTVDRDGKSRRRGKRRKRSRLGGL